MKDTILNKVIRFCLRRCCVDASTARMAIHKLSKGEVRYYLDEYDETEAYWKEHKNPFKRY